MIPGSTLRFFGGWLEVHQRDSAFPGREPARTRRSRLWKKARRKPKNNLPNIRDTNQARGALVVSLSGMAHLNSSCTKIRCSCRQTGGGSWPFDERFGLLFSSTPGRWLVIAEKSNARCFGAELKSQDGSLSREGHIAGTTLLAKRILRWLLVYHHHFTFLQRDNV